MDSLGEVGLALMNGSFSFEGTTLSASASDFLFRSNPKGTISLLAIGTREDAFPAVRERRLVGMTMKAGRGSFI